MEKLALHGGQPVKTTPFGTGTRFGEAELNQVKEAFEQNTLFYWHGNKVKTFVKKFSDMYDMKYCVSTSSGSASIHVALGACGVTEGDEVITTPITDMGSVIGILYKHQHCGNRVAHRVENPVAERFFYSVSFSLTKKSHIYTVGLPLVLKQAVFADKA